MTETFGQYNGTTHGMYQGLGNSILQVEPVVREPRHVSINDIRIFAKSLVMSCDDKKWTEDLGDETCDETALLDTETELLVLHRRLLHIIVSMQTYTSTSRRRGYDASTKDTDTTTVDKAIRGNSGSSITESHDDNVNQFQDTRLAGVDEAVSETCVENTEQWCRSVKDSAESEYKTTVTWNDSVVYISDKSETDTEYEEISEETTCSVNDTVFEKDSNATDDDIDSFSDLPSDASFSDLPDDTEDCNTLDALHGTSESNHDKHVEEADDFDAAAAADDDSFSDLPSDTEDYNTLHTLNETNESNHDKSVEENGDFDANDDDDDDDDDDDSFSDLPDDTEDYNTLDTLNETSESNHDKRVEENGDFDDNDDADDDDDDGDCMCGIFWVYTRGQAGISFI